MSNKTVYTCDNVFDKNTCPAGEIHSEYGGRKGATANPIEDGWFCGYTFPGGSVALGRFDTLDDSRGKETHGDFCCLDCAMDWVRHTLYQKPDAKETITTGQTDEPMEVSAK